MSCLFPSSHLLRCLSRIGLCLLVGGIALACGSDPGSPAGSSSEQDPSAGARVVARLGLHGAALDPAIAKPDFVLEDTHGESYSFRERTDGQLTLLFFGYTSCPDICPVHLANLAAVLQRADPLVRQAVKVVFVGVDPDRDTPEHMREWLDGFDRDFVGLTGTAEELAIAQSAAAVPGASVDREWEGGYSVSHAGWITLFSADNMGRLRYPFGVRQREWAHDLDVLVREGWPGDPKSRGNWEGIIADGPFVSLPPGGNVAALYVRLRNLGKSGDRLLSASSSAARHVMLHQTVNEGGLARMTPAGSGLALASDGELRLEPGGAHIMLMGVMEGYVVGDRVPVTLEFESGGLLKVDAVIVSPGEVEDMLLRWQGDAESAP